jgi:hypothetical protein
MKRIEKIFTLTAIAMIFLMVGAGSVMALPYADIFGNTSEPNLQEIFDANITGGRLDAVDDQSNAAIWTSSEADVDSYLISAYRGDGGTLGIYSFTTGAEYDFDFGSKNQAGFAINDAGALWFDEEMDNNFGDAFGFYWKNTTTGSISYTEDSKNTGNGYGPDNNILALAYEIDPGLEVHTMAYGGKTAEAKGGDDWILAFEDVWSNGDHDFNDAVFYFEDMEAVPEPSTILLLGFGLIGLVGFKMKKFKK